MTADHTSGLLLVVSGPSGVGKTTIVHQMQQKLGGRFSVSATTRPRSSDEVDGKDYYFVSSSEFERMRNGGEFLESAEVFGRHAYGTPRRPVESALANGELIILDIDVQGARQVRQTMPDAYMVFILPPDEDELLRRLQSRGRDDQDAIDRRFAEAKHEINQATEVKLYDAFVINDDLERAVEEVCALVSARRGLPSPSNRSTEPTPPSS
ncbi:MAG: guanylate kinase [Phycisphaerae bacterium]|nr:guanylate kinase [Phycisphaerae bacterium]|tara:strand:- start:1506 stop:2135 length:630 start_codon:yes stop_codon:yes gene_type:complete